MLSRAEAPEQNLSSITVKVRVSSFYGTSAVHVIGDKRKKIMKADPGVTAWMASATGAGEHRRTGRCGATWQTAAGSLSLRL